MPFDQKTKPLPTDPAERARLLATEARAVMFGDYSRWEVVDALSRAILGMPERQQAILDRAMELPLEKP